MDFAKQTERLRQIEHEFPEALSQAFDNEEFEPVAALVIEHVQIKRSIKQHFLNLPAAHLPDDASGDVRAMVQTIVLGHKLRLEELLSDTPLKDLFNDEHTFDELDDLAAKHYFSWYSHYEYVSGMLEVGALIARADDTPAEFGSFLQEMRQCYAFQQYLAVCVLCRTVIEIALRHLCQLEGFFNPEHQNYGITTSYYERKAREQKRSFRIPEDYQMQPADLRALLDRSSYFKKFRSPIGDLYADLSRVVHGNRTISKSEAKNFARDTLQLLHDLYEV